MNANGPPLAWVWVLVAMAAVFACMTVPVYLLGAVHRQGRPSSRIGSRISRGLTVILGMLGGVAIILLALSTLRATVIPHAAAPTVVSDSSSFVVPHGHHVVLNDHSNVAIAPDTAVVVELPDARGPEVPAPVWRQWEPENLSTYWTTSDTSDEPLPEWTRSSMAVTAPDSVIVSSQWFATREEAERQGTSRLAKALYYKLGDQDRWVFLSVPHMVPALRDSALAKPDGVLEVMRKDFGNGLTANMYRAHFRLDHCGRVPSQVPTFWKAQANRERGNLLAGWLGGLTIVFGAAGLGLRRVGV